MKTQTPMWLLKLTPITRLLSGHYFKGMVYTTSDNVKITKPFKQFLFDCRKFWKGK